MSLSTSFCRPLSTRNLVIFSCRRRRRPRSPDLASALRRLLRSDSEIKVIGTRHGEKLYESLVSREEMARAEDLGRYYRLPADSRDLNYEKYFTEGEIEILSFAIIHRTTPSS